MNNFSWQYIKFADGSNPYICMTEKEFKRIQKKYKLEKMVEDFWLAKNKESDDLLYEDLLMEQREQM